jgi:hypothetical protein
MTKEQKKIVDFICEGLKKHRNEIISVTTKKEGDDVHVQVTTRVVFFIDKAKTMKKNIDRERVFKIPKNATLNGARLITNIK